MRNRSPQIMLSVSVIIPCHNEEDNIENCVQRIPRLSKKMEIIVVDDGSKDKTTEVVKRMLKKNRNLKLVSYKTNRGKGQAVKIGMGKAVSDILVILDADMAVRPEDLPKFIKPLTQRRADFINGTRFFYEIEKGAMKPWNYIGNTIFSFLFSCLFKMRVTDSLCGTKALFRKSYKKIKIDPLDPWGDFSLLFGAKKLNLKLIELPIIYHKRVGGRSKMKIFYHGIILIILWFKLLFSYLLTKRDTL